jgi:peroxiredoxin Q/BCP
MLEPGRRAPSFTLPSTSGGTVSLAGLAGRKVVLYFYPRDDTPGCTAEACDFRDLHPRLVGSGAVVLGVSSDALRSHDKFRAKHSLPFDLLSDEDNAVAKKYGAYGEKSLYGRKFLGTIRSTFVIDERGRIAAAWSPVKVKGHAEAVLAALAGAEDAPKPARAAKVAKKSPAARAKAAKKR